MIAFHPIEATRSLWRVARTKRQTLKPKLSYRATSTVLLTESIPGRYARLITVDVLFVPVFSKVTISSQTVSSPTSETSPDKCFRWSRTAPMSAALLGRGCCCAATGRATGGGNGICWRQSDEAVKRQGCLPSHLALSWRNVLFPRWRHATPIFRFLLLRNTQAYLAHHSAQHTAHGTTETLTRKCESTCQKNRKTYQVISQWQGYGIFGKRGFHYVSHPFLTVKAVCQGVEDCCLSMVPNSVNRHL